MITRRRLLSLASAFALSIAHGEPTTYPSRLLFIHGRGQQGLDPKALKAAWLFALKRGGSKIHKSIPTAVNVAFPFYGDKLDEYTRQFGIPLTSDVHARGNSADDEFLQFQAEFAEELRLKAGVTDAQVDAEYGNQPEAHGPLNWKWVQAILRALDKNGGGLKGKALETFTRDVFLYSRRAGVRDEIDRIVAAQLTTEPTVVVAHSLGTVVAYSILANDRRDLRVPLFVTVGSPLAVRAVRDQYLPLRSPACVSAWYNAYDTRDVVALYPLDSENFPVTPAIENNFTVKNHTSNRHGIDGYLDDGAVAKNILGALGG